MHMILPQILFHTPSHVSTTLFLFDSWATPYLAADTCLSGVDVSICHPFRRDTLHCFHGLDSDLLRNQSGETCFGWCLTSVIATQCTVFVFKVT